MFDRQQVRSGQYVVLCGLGMWSIDGVDTEIDISDVTSACDDDKIMIVTGRMSEGADTV